MAMWIVKCVTRCEIIAWKHSGWHSNIDIANLLVTVFQSIISLNIVEMKLPQQVRAISSKSGYSIALWLSTTESKKKDLINIRAPFY